MSTPFQNRLVGTIIVAAAVIIFLPDILDGEKESYQAEFEAIPNAPAFEGAKAHKSFPKEKLESIPTEELSDEEPSDDLLAEEGISANTTAQVDTSKEDLTANANPVVQVEDKVVVSVPQSDSSSVVVEKDKLAWVIHLGSFKHQKNVDELMRKLKENGYTAFTQPIKTKKGVLTKVIVGPDLNKAELEKKLPDLKKLTKVQGRLARFDVTK